MEELQTFLPGWETVREIGSGSSGKVYELRKKDEYGGDFHSALKVVSIPSTQEEYDEMLGSMSEFAMRAKLRDKVEEISGEYRLMGVLKGHPNIVSCEDQMIIPHDNDMGWDIYIRMELLTSLPEYVQQHGMTANEVIRVGIDLCKALEQCGENNIIHRDIKPQNIFVSKYGSYKLGDFGVAKVSSIKKSADKVGTYSYMAPEVYKGKSYDERVDIYSLGMVLYWLLNERRGPFLPLPPENLTSEQIADAQLKRYKGEPLPPPKNGNEALKKLVLKACAYNSEDRFSSPTQMKKALEFALLGKTAEHTAVRDHDATVRENGPERFETYVPEYFSENEVKVKAERPTPKAEPNVKQTAPKHKEKEKSGSSKTGYIVLLVLLLLAMAAALIIYFARGSSDKDSDDKDKTPATPTETVEPTQKPVINTVMLSSPRLTLTEEESAVLTVTCLPEPEAGYEPELVWKSSDTNVAAVNENGQVDAISAGTATIMVYVKDRMEVYDECMVVVEAPYVTEISIEQMPTKTVYSIGEELDTTGLVLRVYYNNGSAKRISDPSEYEASCEMSGLGSQTVTVTYEGVSTEYTIRISLF